MRTKYIENLKVREQLRTGDASRIADLSGVKLSYIRDMLLGRARFTDPVKKAIIQLFKEREALDAEFNSVTK